ncbi:permease [Clostridium manihotivorum]|uniref:Permease n=1 Tax=Clostridium manihotivorum TaxID=2320868 RepID=A0A410DPL8_9CLOT|nr:permease [Clostridium manihotivorum]QAA30990.1 permease [Clostridium manihotivorum]
MKTNIILVTGFLGAGKTSFINGLLRESYQHKSRIVVIQKEKGEAVISSEYAKDSSVNIIDHEKDKPITINYLYEIIKKFSPDTLVIECNGFDKLEPILDIVDSRQLRKVSCLSNVINLVDAKAFKMYFTNLKNNTVEHISNCDLLVVNKVSDKDEKGTLYIEKVAKKLNKNIKLLVGFQDEKDILEVYERSARVNKYLEFNGFNLVICFLLAVFLGYCSFLLTKWTNIHGFNFSKVQIFSTVFLSILIQAVPFILVGVLFSSIIQVFVTSEVLGRFFPKNPILGFLFALISGVALPVCDCAIVPVASRLIKKGIPLPIAITFMLAAPIVNPIAIASTLYAFPNQPTTALYRIYFGATIAFFVGLIFYIFPEKDVALDSLDNLAQCECAVCSDYYGGTKGIVEKVKAIFKHSSMEFFQVGKFLIIGAFLSSLLQVMVPKDIIFNLGGTTITSLLVMMLAAFILSVCSTSDAFIARTFINQLPFRSVLGFMVVGPMIDIKNLSMLLGNFKKKFVVKVVVLIFFVAFVRLTI